MTSSSKQLRTLLLASSLGLLSLAPTLRADTVDLTDGRTFQGKILVDNDQTVRIETMVIGIHTKVSFPKSEVAKVTTAPLPANFFQETLDQPVQVVTGQNLYLDIPISGVIGKDVYADGVFRALTYAKTRGCKSIVFEINSTGGSLEETNKIVQMLKGFQGDFHYYALVQNAIGEALPIALGCERVYVTPTAKLGGTSQDYKSFAQGADAQVQSTLRTHLANQSGEAAGNHYRYPRLVKAMIDPAEADAAWVDDQGAIELGLAVPVGTPQDRIIFQSQGKNDNRVITLSHEQLKELGVEVFTGAAADLGAKLGISSWKLESTYGATAMSTTATYLKEQAANDTANHKRLIKTNIDQRNQVNAYLKHNLQQASMWDPNKGSYQNYDSGWGGSSPLMTNDSRANWKVRTDYAYNYLANAQQAINQMTTLDAQAKRLGLEPTYPDGKLALMTQDIKVKQDYLQGFRNKNGL
jgi:ATP-dependent protease ClpP protease subunit